MGAGDKARYLREVLVPRTLIFVATRFHIYEMDLIAPLANQARSRSDDWNRRNRGI